MGFVNAIKDLGSYEMSKNAGGEFQEIDSFTQVPMEIIDQSTIENPKSKKLPAMEIRVWLEAEDIRAEQLKITGVSKIDSAYFYNGNEDESSKKRRYLYIKTAPSATWKFSPLYKLGAGMPSGASDVLLGTQGEWRTDKESRFYKLQNSTLKAFEESGAFSEGSVALIMDYLEKNIDEIAALWSEKKSSYIMIFSVYEEERFLYPIEVPALLSYFRRRLDEIRGVSGGNSNGTKNKNKIVCGVCGQDTESSVNFDKVFKFATFDKVSFLPGLSSSAAFKVFPVCQDCFQLLSEGRNAADKKFLDTRSIPNVQIYLIPELLAGNVSMGKVAGRLSDFIESGIIGESFVAKKVLEQSDEIIFHFIFWEKNQAQERLLYMVEDVPPSRLRRLEEMWKLSVAASRSKKTELNSVSELAFAIKKIRGIFLSLAGKRENDITFMSDWVLGLIASLLSGRKIDVYRVKSVCVSYLQGLCADSQWVRMNSANFAGDIECIVDFLYRANEEGK